MSKQFDIRTEDNVFVGEDKNLRIYVTDADDQPIDVSAKAMTWYLRAGAYGRIVLQKSYPGDITVVDGHGTKDLVIVPIWGWETAGPLEQIVLPAGVYIHTLKAEAPEMAVLSYGDFNLRLSAARGI